MAITLDELRPTQLTNVYRCADRRPRSSRSFLDGYHPRALAPAVGVAAVASLVVWTGRWYLEDLSDLADRLGSWVVFALAWGVWPALVAVFLYRTVTYTYRLTDRALLVDFGPLSPPVPPVSLVEVTAVVVGGGWLFDGWGSAGSKCGLRIERLSFGECETRNTLPSRSATPWGSQGSSRDAVSGRLFIARRLGGFLVRPVLEPHRQAAG